MRCIFCRQAVGTGEPLALFVGEQRALMHHQRDVGDELDACPADACPDLFALRARGRSARLAVAS